MATPLSSDDAYTDVDAFKECVDWRNIADLVSDDDTEVTEGALDSNPIVTNALLRASGMLESACVPGLRYTPTNLGELTGASAALRDQIVSWIAEGLIYLRRPNRELPETYKAALAFLDQLREGAAIFGLQEIAEAGVMEHTELLESEILTRNDVVIQAREYFGIRGERNRK